MRSSEVLNQINAVAFMVKFLGEAHQFHKMEVSQKLTVIQNAGSFNALALRLELEEYAKDHSLDCLPDDYDQIITHLIENR